MEADNFEQIPAPTGTDTLERDLGGLSSRELVAALARVEDEIRHERLIAPSVPGHVARLARMLRRERQVLAELRLRRVGPDDPIEQPLPVLGPAGAAGPVHA